MSFVPIAAEAAEALAARQVTAGEATLATAALEGARYGYESGVQALTAIADRARSSSKHVIKKGRSKSLRKFFSKGERLKRRYKMASTAMDEGTAARFGEKAGYQSVKQKELSTGFNMNENTIYVTEPDMPTRGSDIDQRERDLIFYRGLKYCFNYDSLTTAGGDYQSLMVNFAIVSRKDAVDSQVNLADDFFRAGGNSRSQDFSTPTNALDRHCLPLNSDKFHIWTHKRFKLHRRTGQGHGDKYFSGYIPINRQIRFDGANKTNGTLFCLTWFGGVAGVVSTPGTVALCNVQGMLTTFWDDTIPIGQIRYLTRQIRKNPRGKRLYKRKRYSTKNPRKS